MDSTHALEMSDVIGAKGTYEILSALSLTYALLANTAVLSYIQFLAPKVTIYWNWDEASPNRTNFDSNNCKMEDIKLLDISSVNFTVTSKLIYESEYSENTLTEKFGMVCENSWMVSFTKSLNAISIVVSGTVLGMVTEKYGRKKTFTFMTTLAVLANLGMLFAQSYIMFAISYMIVSECGYFGMNMFITIYSEILSSSRRSLVHLLYLLSSVTGFSLCSAVSWISNDWFYTQLYATLIFVFLLPISWYTLESPTWLIGKGRRNEANKNLLKMAKRNGYLNEETESKADVFLTQLEEIQKRSQTADRGKISDLFKNKFITKYTVSLIIVTSFCNACSTGVSLNVEAFGAGLYIDYFILQGACVLIIPVTYFGIRMSSSKFLQVILLLATTIITVSYTFLYIYPVGRTAISVLTRAVLFQVISFNMVYVPEVFPDSVRVIGQALVSSGSRILVCFSPFVKEIGERTAIYVPFIMFSCMSLICATIFYFLPNTSKKHLAHTVDDLIKTEPEQGQTSVFTISTRL